MPTLFSPTYTASKDPADISDWDIEWDAHLESGETIASSGWVIQSGLSYVSDVIGTTATKVWLRYGTPGKTHALQNTITTSGGRTLERTVYLRVESL